MTNTLPAKASFQYEHPIEKVFNAWLDPIMVGNWMFGPNIRDEEVVSIEIDPKEGGEFSFLVKRQTLVVDHIGKYIRINKPKELHFSWGVKGMSDNSLVKVTFSNTPVGCKIDLVHELDPAWKDYFERCQQGWLDMLAALDKALKNSR